MIRGSLFTRFFLEDGIRETEAYRRFPADGTLTFANAAAARWRELAAMPRASEAETEAEFIFPVLDLLGWQHLPQQEPGRGRHDVADALLFTSAEAKTRARPLRPVERFCLGAVVVENEARHAARSRERQG